MSVSLKAVPPNLASPPHRQPAMPLPLGVAAANVEPLKRHRASTYGFSESGSIMSANELRRGVGLPAGGVPSRGLECLELLTKPVAGPTGRENLAQG